ncbi:hypothetical protein A4A49_27849 [Nicotiana attenuata]|uniref:Inosine/uridine-preferring nucleoside hydrolase domain-containing protein n=1 Tax=Nicotiana attenuata TaxID=49451 RepID=A0A1J6IIN5_NICAT|nr:hypothetical protein A4A49_27849 [Nicotiana attenuata]
MCNFLSKLHSLNSVQPWDKTDELLATYCRNRVEPNAILVSQTGWANAATIDSVYDLLHMMGRDDIPVGLGDVFAMNQSDPVFSAVGNCRYNKVIPQGSGGYLDSDTLYGLARSLPRSPRRYTAENSAKFGAPRDTDHPELRQPLASEVLESVVKSLDPGSKISILTNGPLTNIAKIVLEGKNTSKAIQASGSSIIADILIVGGHINHDNTEKGNVINVPSNKFAELNMFLDPLAAKTVLSSEHNIILIPLGIQRKDMFVGEILGAVVAGDLSALKSTFEVKKLKVSATGVESEDGEIIIDKEHGKAVKVLENVDPSAYYNVLAKRLGDEKQFAVIGSFNEQRRIWSIPSV